MKYLIKSATITDPNSPFNGTLKDILIAEGLIVSIEDSITDPSATVYEAKGQSVSPGWMDMNANLGEPGFEAKEDLQTGCAAAAAGGFTAIAVMPATNPPIDTKSGVEYLINRAKGLAVEIYPIGCITQGRQGIDISEMYDMTQSGAVAFSDGNRPIQNAGTMMRALQYVLSFDGLIISRPEDASVTDKAQVNEGPTATYLGMKGIPNMAEELMVARDLSLMAYVGGKIHFAAISTAQSVELIRAAKKKGLQVTADVAAHHLLLDETALTDFDSNYKVSPPLRTQTDIKALKKGLQDGTIDAVVSQHTPHEIECKAVEFQTAAFGVSALETAYAVFNQACRKVLSTDEMVRALAIRPREILNIPVPSIALNAQANLTFFNPDEEWTLKTADMKSKGKNTPFIGMQMKGRVKAIFTKGKLLLSGN